MDSVEIVIQYFPAFRAGFATTLQLAGIAWAFGLTIGGLLGAAAHFHPRSVGVGLRSLAFMLSAVPLLVLLYWLHYPAQTLLNVVVPPFVTAAFLLSLLNAVAVAEIWRGAMDDVKREYMQAARVCGMSMSEAMRQVQIPLAFRHALPMLLGAQVFILQSTLFSSLISVEELFRVAQRINSTIYRPVQIYTGLAAFFAAICLPLYLLAFCLRRRYLRDLSER